MKNKETHFYHKSEFLWQWLSAPEKYACVKSLELPCYQLLRRKLNETASGVNFDR